MTYRIAALFILLLTSCVSTHKCKRIAEGTFYVKHDKQFSSYDDYELKISGNRAEQNYKNGKVESEIVWIDENRFRLIREGEKKDSLTELQKQLNSLGNPYFEITNCEKKNASFALWHNPHIRISSGKFIRKK